MNERLRCRLLAELAHPTRVVVLDAVCVSESGEAMSMKRDPEANRREPHIYLARHDVSHFRAGRRQPNGTDFTSVTRSVSEGNKGKRLMSSPSLTLRVSKVSAIGRQPPGSSQEGLRLRTGGLTPPRSEVSSRTARGIAPDRHALAVALCWSLIAVTSWCPAWGQERSPRPAASGPRTRLAPIPLESGMAPVPVQPWGTVSPQPIGAGPVVLAPPGYIAPSPDSFGPPGFGPSPFLPTHGAIPSPQSLPQFVSPYTVVPAVGMSSTTEVRRVPVEQSVAQVPRPANLRISVSEEFLNRFVARDDVQPGPVRDNVLGADVTGRQTTTSRLLLDLRPSRDKASAAFVLTGDVQMQVTGTTPQAMVDTTGQQHFVAVKDVFFDGRLLSTKHATVYVRARNQTVGAMTPLSGSVFGGLAERIAYRAAERMRPEAEAIARDRLAEKVYPAFDGEIDKQLSTANSSLERQLRKRLELAQLAPSSQFVSTTDNRLEYGAVIGGKSATAAARVPQVTADDDLSKADGALRLMLHESLLNELIERTELRGFHTTDKELKQRVAELLGSLSGVKVSIPAEKPATAPFGLPLPGMSIVTHIEFNEVDPLTVRLDQDRLTVTIKAAFKPAGQKLFPPMTVTIEYRAVVEGNVIRLIAGKPRAQVQGQEDLSREPTVAELAIQNSLTTALPTLEVDQALAAAYWPHHSPVPRVTSFNARDGWMAVAID